MNFLNRLVNSGGTAVYLPSRALFLPQKYLLIQFLKVVLISSTLVITAYATGHKEVLRTLFNRYYITFIYAHINNYRMNRNITYIN